MFQFLSKHPSYKGEPTLWENDIALIKLSSPVTYTNEIKPICLPPQSNNKAAVGITAVVTGWGRTRGFGSDEVLMQTTVPVNPITDCTPSSDNMICAGLNIVGLQKGVCMVCLSVFS